MPKELGQALRDARKAMGISIAELARCISASPSNLSLIELGKGSPSMRTITRVCDHLGLDVAMILQAKKKGVGV